jgi:hypothetical protein
MRGDTTRWTVSVSKETDIIVRSFLAQRGMKKGDLSKFIEDSSAPCSWTRPCRRISSFSGARGALIC